MSRLRRPSLYDRDIFVDVDLLTVYACGDAAEQQSQCGLAIGRVRLPAYENARIQS